jgi:serine/threonine-protein kinase HipA
VTTTLGIGLNGTIVGYLTQTKEGQITFRFTDSYLSMPNRPVLSQSFEDDLTRTYSGSKRSLPPFFANLIPELGPLRELIESNLGVSADDDLALLEAVGRDLPGAVEIIRVDDGDLPIQDSLETTNNYVETLEDNLHTEESGLRFSLAGVQLKFSVLRNPDRITLPGRNQDGDWIVKLGSTRFPFVVENEYAIMQWAKAAGFDVPECYLQDAKTVSIALKEHADFGDTVFVIRRYDRSLRHRIHQEDFAQVTGLRPALKYDHIKYEQCGGLVKQLIGDDAYYEFIRRLTFAIASGNADAHLKNWSLLYLDGSQPSLAPMYDQVCTIAWEEIKSELALKLAGTKNWFELNFLTRFELLAKRAGADPNRTVETVQETLSQLVYVWNTSNTPDLLPPDHARRLQEFWGRVPLLRPFSSSMQWPS